MELLTAETPKPRGYDQDRRGSARKRRAPALLCDVKSALTPALSGKRRRVPITVARKPRRTSAGNVAALKKVSAASSRGHGVCESVNAAALSDGGSVTDGSEAVTSGDEDNRGVALSNALNGFGGSSSHHRLSHASSNTSASRKLWKRRAGRRRPAAAASAMTATTPVSSSAADSKGQIVRRLPSTPTTDHIEFDSEDSTEEEFLPEVHSATDKRAVLAFPVAVAHPSQQPPLRGPREYCEEAVGLSSSTLLSSEDDDELAARHQVESSLLNATSASPPGTPREEVLPRAPSSPGQCPPAPKRHRRPHLSLGRALMANAGAQVRAAARVEEVNSPVWVRNAENGLYTLELPLLYAAANCSAAVLDALLEAGAEPAAVDARGLTSFDLLEKRHREAPQRSATLTRAECATAMSTLIRYGGIDGGSRRHAHNNSDAVTAAAMPELYSFIDDETVDDDGGNDQHNSCDSTSNSQMMFLLPFTPCA